jgi:hypothetical protein
MGIGCDREGEVGTKLCHLYPRCWLYCEQKLLVSFIQVKEASAYFK